MDSLDIEVALQASQSAPALVSANSAVADFSEPTSLDALIPNASPAPVLGLSNSSWQLRLSGNLHHEVEEDIPSAPLRPKLAGKSSPGPGAYIWQDDVNLNKPPVWTMSSPERKHLDTQFSSWTPLPSTHAARAPPPTEYSNIDYETAMSYHGRLGAPKWSMGKPSQPRLPGPPPALPNRHFALVGGTHPARPMPPIWTMRSPERTNLPNDAPTWQPRSNTDLKPGPGQYRLASMGQGSRYKPTTRLGCTFGGRPRNLHPGTTSWTPSTHGSHPPSSEHLRLKKPKRSKII